MVSAYPGLFYPGQVYPSQEDSTPPPPPPPPGGSGDTTWGSWKLAHDGTWIRRETRVLVWGLNTGPDVVDGGTNTVTPTDILDGSSGTDILDGIYPPAAPTDYLDGNGTTDVVDGGGTITNIDDGNG